MPAESDVAGTDEGGAEAGTRAAGAGTPGAERSALLRALRAETVAQIAALDGRVAAITAARADANSDDEHDPEGATVGFERAQEESLRAAARRRLVDIDAALTRIASGTDGRCAICGAPIPPARLVARPATDRCVRHA